MRLCPVVTSFRAIASSRMQGYFECVVSCSSLYHPFEASEHGANECHFDHLSYVAPAAMDTINREVGTNVKSLYDSCIGSLSTCSAIVNVDESQRVRMQAEDTSPLLRVTREHIQRTDKMVLKDTSKDVNEVHVVDRSPSCGQPVGVILGRFHNREDSTAGGTFNTESINIMERSQQEAITNCESLASAGSQLSGPAIGENEHNTDVLSYLQANGSNQLKSNGGQFVECRPSLGRNADPHQTPEVISQDESPCLVSAVDVKTPILSAPSCEKMMLAMVIPFPASIKPKDVISAVGQRLFWKARKALLRQQEVFSNQVFELHKLIKVQKLLAKMPSPLIGEYMRLGEASDKLCCHLLNEGGSNEQENLGDKRARAPAPSKKSGGQALESKPQQKFLRCAEKSEGQKVRAGVSSIASFPQVLTNAPSGQPCHSLSSDGMSAWGYPMGPLNRPFIYPSGSSSLPSPSPFGGAFVIGPNPPMAPFAFPCYSQRPEQTSDVCVYNQWPAAMYHNPFLAPVVNDWFAMNHQGRASLASGSEKAGPTSSVQSINMKADASTQSIQPAVFPCVLDSSSRLIATRSLGSHATASASTPPNALSRKPGAGNVGEQSRGPSPWSSSGCVAPEGWGGYKGEKKKADTEGLGRLRNVKGTINGGRADRIGVDSSLGGSALNLFPLQPSSSSGGHSEGRITRQADCQGRVIKAVPRSALAASESAAGILLSIQREKQL